MQTRMERQAGEAMLLIDPRRERMLLTDQTKTQTIQHLNEAPLPDALRVAAIAAIQQDAAENYAVLRQAEYYEAQNTQHKLHATFFPVGIRLTSLNEDQPWQWGMQLTGYGYGERRERLTEAILKAQGNRVDYQRDTLTEWYLNGPLGLEQGFTLHAPPGERQADEPLVLDLEFQSGWTLELAEDRQHLILKQADGTQILHYGHLYVTDAIGQLLPVQLAYLGDNADCPQIIQIRVDDRTAVYPIVIDPLVQQGKLIADDGAANDNLGYSVALDGNTAVVGAYKADVSTNTDRGAAYVFVRNGSTWVFQAKLVASDGAAGDQFGYAVALHVDTIVVGAPLNDNTNGTNAGAAYVFVRSENSWSEQQKLIGESAGTHTNDNFGWSVAVEGDVAVVGAPNAPGVGVDQGVVYVFNRVANSWGSTWAQKIQPGGTVLIGDDNFGWSVALNGNTLVVGAKGFDNGSNSAQGAIFFFLFSGGTWSAQGGRLYSSDGAYDDRFGSSVTVVGDIAAIGAPYNDNANGTDAGAVYIFSRSAGSWSQTQKLLASDGAASDQFGTAVALISDRLIIGAPQANIGANGDQGAAYTFVRSGSAWTQQSIITAGDGTANDQFGSAVALNGNTAIVGAALADVSSNTNQGATYAFVLADPSPSPNSGSPSDSLSWAGEVVQAGLVALRTGEKIETATDIAVYTPVGAMDFTRTYRQSKRSIFQFMGLGWQHSHAPMLVKTTGTPNTLLIQMPNGGELKLSESSAGSNHYVADAGSDAVVDYNTGTSQYTLIGSDKSTYIFNASGKLVSRQWPPFGTNGEKWNYTYDGSGRLSSVDDNYTNGRKLNFAYINNPGQYNDGQLWRIGDQDTTNLTGSGSSFGGSSVKDDFNRSNSASLGSNWGTYWGTANLDVNGNECRNPASSGVSDWHTNYYNVAQYGPDCEAFITLRASPTTQCIIGVRVGGTLSSPNSYGFNANGGGSGVHKILRVDNGTDTQLGATFNQTLAVGDSIGISAIGSTISAYYKPSGGSWTLLASRTDTTYSGAGYLALESEIGGWKCDDFTGGTVSGSAPSGRYVELGYTPQKSNGVTISTPKPLLNTVRDVLGNTWAYRYYGQTAGETDASQLDFLIEIISPSVDTTGDGTADGSLSLEQLSYTTSGTVITNLTQNLGNNAISTAYAFQPGGQNVTTETVAGKVGTHTFSDGVYSGFQDPAGNVNQQVTNFQYRPEIVQDANAQQTQIGWSADGKFLQTLTDALGRVTTYSYNTTGASADTLDYILDAEGRKTQYLYGDSANPLLPTAIKFYDTDGTTVLRWQAFGYDSHGRMTIAKLLDPANGTTVMQEIDRAYYSTGAGIGLLQTETIVDPITPANNSTTTFTYDNKGRVIKTQKTSLFGCCKFTYKVYDEADHVVAAISSDISQTIPTTKAAAIALYDSAHPDQNRVTTYDYDTLGRRVLTTTFDGAGYAVKELTAYDALGRVIRTIANYVASGSILNPYTVSRASFSHGTNTDQNLVTDSFYNARGMLRKQIDPLDNVTLYGYDDAGRLVKTIHSVATPNYNNDYSGVSPDPTLASYSASSNADQDIVTTQAYDKAGNLVKTVDAAGVVSYTVYDVLNRPVKVVRAAKDTATITLNVGDGSYNAANDPRSASYLADAAPDRDLIETTEYDKMGRVIRTQHLLENRATSEWETSLYGYDGLGRSVKVIRVASSAAYNIAADPTLASYSASSNADQDIITRTAYDKAERVMYTEDNFGQKSWTGYDGLSRPVKNVVNAVGTATDGSSSDPRSSSYSPNSAVDKDLVLVIAYNSDGQVQSVTDALGRITRYTYDTVGRVTNTVQNFVDPGEDPALWVYSSGWKKSDGTTAISHGTDNDQNIVSRTVYDGKGRPVQQIDHRNNVTLTVYDTLDRVIMTISNYVVQGSSQPANWIWNTTNSRWENGVGNAIAFGTDNDQNRITTMTYDLLGRVLRMRDAAGTETRYTVDLLGRRTQTIASYVNGVFNSAFPDEDLISTSVFNKTGQVTSTTDVRGTQTTFTYDKLYRRLTLTRAAGTALSSLTYTCYDKAGRVQRTIQNWSNTGSPDAKDGNGNWMFVPSSNGSSNDTDLTLDSRFDKASRPLKRIINYRAQGITNPSSWIWSTANSRWEDGGGSAITFGTNTDQNLINLMSYYKNGQIESTTDAEGVVAKVRYDLLRRQVRQVQAWVDQTEDPALWVWDATDTRWEKSTGNVAIAHGTNTDQNIIQDMTYDKGSRVLTQRDPRGNVTTFVYDQLNRRKSLTNPLSKVWSSVYADLPGAGVRTTTTYPGITGAANYTVQQDMDRMGRLLSVQYGNPSNTPDVKLGYDAAGNRAKMSEYSAASFTTKIRETQFSYDKVHRMSSAAFDNDGNGTLDETVSYQYDAGGLRTQLTLPGSLNVTYTYDARGRLISLTDWDSQQSQMVYDLADRHLTTTRANQMKTEYQYDAGSRVRLLKHTQQGSGSSFGGSSVKDNFNRSNSASLGSNWGTYWGTANLDVNGNECRNPASSGVSDWHTNYYNVAQYGPDCEAFITLKASPTTQCIIGVRVGGTLSSPNSYGFNANGGGNGVHKILRVDNGVETQLGATFNQTLAVGDSIGISAIGSIISAYYKPSGGSWTLLASRTDTTYSSAGYLGLESEIGGWKCDDFTGGTASGTSAATTLSQFEYIVDKRGNRIQALEVLANVATTTDTTIAATDKGLALTGTWSTVSGFKESTDTSAVLKLLFLSNLATLTMGKGPDHSTYDLYIDGVFWQTVDGYAASATQVDITVPTVTLVTEGPHVLEIRNKNAKNGSSSGYKVRFKQLLVMDKTWTQQNIKYSYDKLARVLEARYCPGLNLTAVDADLQRRYLYTYDRMHNRLTESVAVNGGTPTVKTLTYNAANQISSSGYTYDNNGNLTSDGTNTYTWDRANRLLSMGSSAYKYDGAGNRIQQTVGANVSKYLLDLNSSLPTMLAETIGANVTRFVHSLHGLHQLKTSGGVWEHILTDALGSLRVATDNTVGVLESRNYGVYGDLFGTTGTNQTSYGYTGEPTDGNGLVYDRARYMSPALGQFVSLDPMETFNRYAYVDGNPVMRIDPSGMLLAGGGGAAPKPPTNPIVSGVITGALIGNAIGGILGAVVGGVVGGITGAIFGGTSSSRSAAQQNNNGGGGGSGVSGGSTGGGGSGAGPGLVYGGGVPPAVIIVHTIVNTLSAINFANMSSRFGRGFNGGSCPTGFTEHHPYGPNISMCQNSQGASMTPDEAAREAANPPATGSPIDLFAAFKQNVLAPIALGAYKYIDWWNGVLTPIREHPLESLVIGMGVPLAAYGIYATGGKILDPIKNVLKIIGESDVAGNALAGAGGYWLGTLIYNGIPGVKPVALDAGKMARYAVYGATIGLTNKVVKSFGTIKDDPISRGGLMAVSGVALNLESYLAEGNGHTSTNGALISIFGGLLNGITGQIPGWPGVVATTLVNTIVTDLAYNYDASVTASVK